MSNAFDIEKAKAGEPVECQSLDGQWYPCDFVGMLRGGKAAVIQYRNTDSWRGVAISELRMAPKKVKVRYRNYKLCDAVAAGVSMIVDGPGWETPEAIEKKSWFRGWIHTDWQEAEIEQ
jgi:hypothetical protein